MGAEPDGGTFGPLYGGAWAAAGERVERWMREGGLTTRRDAVGNLWGRADGEGKSIITGSHIDTVRHGGRLDGALGIVAVPTAGATSLQDKREAQPPPRSVGISEGVSTHSTTKFCGARRVTRT